MSNIQLRFALITAKILREAKMDSTGLSDEKLIAIVLEDLVTLADEVARLQAEIITLRFEYTYHEHLGCSDAND